MSIFVVDVESDGPVPGLYSMISFGAVKVDKNLGCTFYGETAPISDQWIPGALAVSNISREQHSAYPSPEIAIKNFAKWIEENTEGRPVFMSDNNGFDAAFINYYMHRYNGSNPFGFSSRRIGDFYAGLVKDITSANRWKYLRKTKHTHNPVDDAKGNAEALIAMCMQHNVQLRIR